MKKVPKLLIKIIFDMHFKKLKTYSEISKTLGISRGKIAGIIDRHRDDNPRKHTTIYTIDGKNNDQKK